MKIDQIKAIEVLDSRGNPTVKCFITLTDGSVHSAAVPSGASTGKYEAVELRDGDTQRYAGNGVLKAVENINTTIYDVLKGREVDDPKKIDEDLIELDGTKNKERLGANALLAVSMAIHRVSAYSTSSPLWKFLNTYYMEGSLPAFPGVFVNVINGGKHADWNFDIQEYILAIKMSSISESVRAGSELFHALGKHLKSKGFSTLVGDEGGYSPGLSSDREVFETILEAAKTLPYTHGKDWQMSLDVAASEFYKDGNYMLMKDNKTVTPEELTQKYMDLINTYGLYSIEDPFDQDDWEQYQKFTSLLAGKTFVVGDDFLVTNPERIQRAIDEKSASAGLIKLNQIGTVKETMDAIKMCQKADWKVVVSHRSGETEDTFIADLAYAVGADYIKTGSMSRSERLAKYNRLMEIEKLEI